MVLIPFAVDTFLTGGRGSPNAISPGSDGYNWTQIRGDQTPSYASNQGVFTYGSTSNLGVWVYASSISQTDQEVLVNLVQSTANNEVAGAIVRCTDDSHFYHANIGNSSGNVEIGKKIGGTFTSLATAPFSSSFGTKYSMRFQAIGSVLKAKIWDAAISEPTAWSVQVTDTSLFAGNFGVCMAPIGSSSVKFDTFSATNGDNPPANPINPVYGSEQRGLVAGATNADLVPAQDISAYEMWSLQIDAIASGGTITFQGSNDGVNYRSVAAYKEVDGSIVSSTAAVGMFSGPRRYRYFRARQTAWTSGLSTGTFELFTNGI